MKKALRGEILAVLRPREGICSGKKILATPHYSQHAVFASPLSTFSHYNCIVTQHALYNGMATRKLMQSHPPQ